MGSLLIEVFRGIAEGSFGEPLKRAYWWAAGLKTWTGLLLGIAWFALTSATAQGMCDCSTWASWVGAVSVALVSVGLVDAGFRAQPPSR